MVDGLEFAWLLGFGCLKWPRDLCTSYRLLGSCVAPIHARIVNGWISIFLVEEIILFPVLVGRIQKGQ